MDQQRQGEIALALIKYLARKDRGLEIIQDREKFENLAKTVNVPAKELEQFAISIAQKLVEECFSAK